MSRSLRPLGSCWGKEDRKDDVAHTTWREESTVTITCAQDINVKTPVRELHMFKEGLIGTPPSFDLVANEVREDIRRGQDLHGTSLAKGATKPLKQAVPEGLAATGTLVQG